MIPPAWRRRLAVVVDVAAIVAVVVCFYRPALVPGLPTGDFASFVTMSEIEDRLVPSWTSLPTWNPYLMCGRPTTLFKSPFKLLQAPLRGLEPIPRMKALVLLFSVLSGLTMYALLLRIGAGRWAALFGGVAYPIMPHQVIRVGQYGQVHLPMFYALVPLLFLAVFGLRAARPRPVVIFALILALLFVRDVQRTLLLLVCMALLLAFLIVAERLGKSPQHRRWEDLAVLLGAGFALAVLADAMELVNRSVSDPYRGGWRPGLQEQALRKWALDNLYTFVDRAGVLGTALGRVSPDFDAGWSRYLGLSLVALVLLGALFPERLGPWRRRFRFVLLLLPVSVWLSAGPFVLWPTIVERWRPLFAPGALPLLARAALIAGLALIAATGVAVVARNVPGWRRRPLRAAALFAALTALLLGTAPLPWVQRVVFFLKEFRNPDWIQTAVAPFAVCFPAALVVAAAERAWGTRRGWPAVAAVLVLLPVLDFWPYRTLLTKQRSPDAIADFREVYSRIGADPGDFRVAGVEEYGNVIDLGYLWHRKRLAWDFRDYSAPRHTLAFMSRVHGDFRTGGRPAIDAAAVLLGLANVKYVVDENRVLPDIVPSDELTLVEKSDRLTLYENRAWRPYVQAWPEAHLLAGNAGAEGPALAGRLAAAGIALVAEDDPGRARSLAPGFPVVYATAAAPVDAGAGTRVVRFPSADASAAPAPPFATEPRLSWERPAPERIRVQTSSAQRFFLVVSESYHPWWRATLDGADLPVLAGEHAFIGAFVPAGDHRVELSFHRPWTYWLWGWVSLVTLAACAAFLVATRGRRADAEDEALL